MSSPLAINDAGDVLTYDGQQWKPAPLAVDKDGGQLVYDGSAWKPKQALIAGQKGKEAAKDNYVSGVLDSVARGQSFGLSDELAAATNAALAPVSRFVLNHLGLRDEQPSDNDTFSQRYQKELEFRRRFSDQFAKDHPVASTVGNIAGNLITTGAMAPVLAPGEGAGLVGNTIKYGASGAAIGGAQGFNEGEGDFTHRVVNAVPGAVIGGAFGAAAPVIGAGVRQLVETAPGRKVVETVVSPLARKLAGAPPASLSAAAPDGTPGVTGPLTQFAESTGNVAQSGAIQRLATAMQRSGLSKAQIERRLAELGPEATLADVDNQFMRQARVANTLPGETSSRATNILEGRERGRPDRMIAAFQGSENPPPTFQLMGEGQGFDQNLRAVGQRVYGEMDAAGLRQSPELIKLIDENPYVSQAIDRVLATEKATRAGTDRAPASGPEIMHKVKQAIWDMGFDKDTARPGPMASYFRDLGTEFVDRLKAANPKLAEADRAYAEAASLPDYFTQGYKFLSPGTTEAGMNSSSPALAEALAKANPQQQIAARAGMINNVRDTVQGRGALAKSLALAKDIRNGREIQSRLAQISPEQTPEIMRRAEAETVFEKTKRDILGGSQTADKAAEIGDSAGIRITPDSIQPRLYERLADMIAKLGAPNEAVRNEIGRLTLNMDQNEKSRVLARILAELERRQRGSFSPAIAGTIGNQFGGP